VDDDGDGAIDCDDTDCEGDAACASTGTCTLAGDLGSSIGYALATGSTTGAGEHFTTSCTSTDAEDAIWSWTAPADGDYAIDLYDSGYDTVVGLLSSDCATEIDCNDDSSGLTSYLEFTATAGETFNIQVTGYSTTGDYVLSVYATSEVDCTDGTDEDGDDELDCADLDCVGDAACPAETACDDGLDDDGDGTTDCDDYDCESDAACAPTCEAEGDLGSELGYGLATGSTADADDIFTSSCSSSAYTAPDEIWTWTAPATGTYTADLVDSTYDTVLAIGSADCTSETTCDDDTIGTISVVAFTATAGDTLSFVVSGFSSSGDYTLSIYSDTEIDCADGEDEDGDGRTDCDDLECTTEAACAPTVETTCDDGLDDDADGLVDCDDTDCAADAACLVESACADGLDDDADGLVDCDDTDCAASADCPS
jgi:hypothetical protein